MCAIPRPQAFYTLITPGCDKPTPNPSREGNLDTIAEIPLPGGAGVGLHLPAKVNRNLSFILLAILYTCCIAVLIHNVAGRHLIAHPRRRRARILYFLHFHQLKTSLIKASVTAVPTSPPGKGRRKPAGFWLSVSGYSPGLLPGNCARLGPLWWSGKSRTWRGAS